MDRAPLGTGPPLLYETCIFFPTKRYNSIVNRELPESKFVDRYATRQEALNGHAACVQRLHDQSYK